MLVGLEVSASEIRQGKKKVIQIQKSEVKLSLFTDVRTVYVENLMESTKKVLDLISEFIKVAGFKISIKNKQNSIYEEHSNIEIKMI